MELLVLTVVWLLILGKCISIPLSTPSLASRPPFLLLQPVASYPPPALPFLKARTPLTPPPGGVATMTSQLPSLSSCAGFALCDQARALQSTAWVSWAALSVLMVGLIGVGAGESAGRGDGVWARGFGVVVRAGQREKQ